MTWKFNSTLRHPKMHPQTKFGVPTSNNVRDMLPSQVFKKRSQDPKIVNNTLPIRDASTHQIRDSYLKTCRRYAPDTIILEIMSEIKVTVTPK